MEKKKVRSLGKLQGEHSQHGAVLILILRRMKLKSFETVIVPKPPEYSDWLIQRGEAKLKPSFQMPNLDHFLNTLGPVAKI